MSDAVSPSDPFSLRIEVGEPRRLETLRAIFAALARIKELQFGPEGDGDLLDDADDEDEDDPDWMDDDDPRWRELLDEEARRHFARAFDYESEEGRVYRRLWELTSPAKRRDPMLTPPGPWPFESVVASIYRAEYLLTELVSVDETTAVLRYDPLAGPFGGTDSLVQLVEAFGHRVVHDSWNDGPSYRPAAGWDYERAKALVAKGRGIE